jgi:hypothetical protein
MNEHIKRGSENRESRGLVNFDIASAEIPIGRSCDKRSRSQRVSQEGVMHHMDQEDCQKGYGRMDLGVHRHQVVSELVLACIFQARGVKKRRSTLIHIKWYQSGILSVYFRQEEKRGAEEDRVVEDSVRTCLQVGSSP